MKKKPQLKKRVVKAWAHFNEKGKVISVSVGSHRPDRIYLGTWSFPVDRKNMAPCTITYTIGDGESKAL